MEPKTYAIAAMIYDAIDGDERGIEQSQTDIIVSLESWLEGHAKENDREFDLEKAIESHANYAPIVAWFDDKAMAIAKVWELDDLDQLAEYYPEITGRNDWYLDIYYAGSGAAGLTEFWNDWGSPEVEKVSSINFYGGYPEMLASNMGFDILAAVGIDMNAEDEDQE